MLAWSSVGTDSLLEPASSGRERNCRFWIHVSASEDAAWFLLTRKWNNELRLDLRRRSFRKTRVTPVSWLVTSFWWHRFTISVLQQTVTLFIWSSETPHVKLVAQFKQGQKISCQSLTVTYRTHFSLNNVLWWTQEGEGLGLSVGTCDGHLLLKQV